MFFAVICMAQITNAQTKPQAEALHVYQEAGKIMMDWSSEKALANHEYWAVQASEDAVNFKTLGLVMGENPEAEKGYSFKQNKNKMSGKYTYFRVLRMNQTTEAIASKTIRL